MMNKLKFGYSYVLVPLSKELETSNQDEETFQDIVRKVIVYSPNEIGFHLKCGITLRERIER